MRNQSSASSLNGIVVVVCTFVFLGLFMAYILFGGKGLGAGSAAVEPVETPVAITPQNEEEVAAATPEVSNDSVTLVTALGTAETTPDAQEDAVVEVTSASLLPSFLTDPLSRGDGSVIQDTVAEDTVTAQVEDTVLPVDQGAPTIAELVAALPEDVQSEQAQTAAVIEEEIVVPTAELDETVAVAAFDQLAEAQPDNALEFDVSDLAAGQHRYVEYGSQRLIVSRLTPEQHAMAVYEESDRAAGDLVVLVATCEYSFVPVQDTDNPEGGWRCPIAANNYDVLGRFEAGTDPADLPIPTFNLTESGKLQLPDPLANPQ